MHISVICSYFINNLLTSFIVSSIFLMYYSYNFQFCFSHFLNSSYCFQFLCGIYFSLYFLITSLLFIQQFLLLFFFLAIKLIATFLTWIYHTKTFVLQMKDFLTSILLQKKSSEVRCNEILTHSQMGGGIVSCSCTKFVSSHKVVFSHACILQETEAFFLKVQKPTVWCSDESMQELNGIK